MLPTEDTEYGSNASFSCYTSGKAFSLAGRQGQKSYCTKWQTQEPLIRDLVCFLGPVLPKKSLLKEPVVFPSQNLSGNATGRHRGTLYLQIFLNLAGSKNIKVMNIIQ